MQSDGNSFLGDVVLDSFNKASRDEDSILDQIYRKSTKPKFNELLVVVFPKICILFNNSLKF